MTESNIDIQTKHFKNLLAIAYADGTLKEEEEQFLLQRAKEFKIPKIDVKKMITDANDLNFSLPNEYKTSLEQLTDIIFIALIDGDLHEKEYAICLRIAESLKLTKMDLDNTLSLIKTLWS